MPMPHSGLRWSLLRDILRVGAVAALITVQTNLTFVMATGLVGRFWLAAIARYGTGSRRKYLLVPIVFGFGGPFVSLAAMGQDTGHVTPEETIERELPAVPSGSWVQLLTVDGAVVPFHHGEWAEVKTLAIGTVRDALDGRIDPAEEPLQPVLPRGARHAVPLPTDRATVVRLAVLVAPVDEA